MRVYFKRSRAIRTSGLKLQPNQAVEKYALSRAIRTSGLKLLHNPRMLQSGPSRAIRTSGLKPPGSSSQPVYNSVSCYTHEWIETLFGCNNPLAITVSCYTHEWIETYYRLYGGY